MQVALLEWKCRAQRPSAAEPNQAESGRCTCSPERRALRTLTHAEVIIVGRILIGLWPVQKCIHHSSLRYMPGLLPLAAETEWTAVELNCLYNDCITIILMVLDQGLLKNPEAETAHANLENTMKFKLADHEDQS